MLTQKSQFYDSILSLVYPKCLSPLIITLSSEDDFTSCTNTDTISPVPLKTTKKAL